MCTCINLLKQILLQFIFIVMPECIYSRERFPFFISAHPHEATISWYGVYLSFFLRSTGSIWNFFNLTLGGSLVDEE